MQKLLHLPSFAFFLSSILVLFHSCHKEPGEWTGTQLIEPRDQLSVEELRFKGDFPLMDMSYFDRPEWADDATLSFSGSIALDDTEMVFPIDRAYYEGENIFPGITLDFISYNSELIPVQKEILIQNIATKSLWNVIMGTGKIWHEKDDEDWNRASFPLSLTDSYIGQVRNCVGTFVYKEDAISKICVQCSQETSDLNDRQVGNMQVVLTANYKPQTFSDSASIVTHWKKIKDNRLQIFPLSSIDESKEIGHFFSEKYYTNASTSLGAVIKDERIYLHPPKTRHGLYPYPEEMRHGVYSVSKSLTGALALFYMGERFGDEVFEAQISDYIPALAHHEGWKGVSFLQTLNMVSGTEGGEENHLLFNILVEPRSMEECIQRIASLGDYPGAPGEIFNYASTNLFVLSYAMQQYVEEKLGSGIAYWDLIQKDVLEPMGAGDFMLMHTVEPDGSRGLPLLAYGAWPNLDHAAKIALLFSNEGIYNRNQLIHREKCREALGRTDWPGYSTSNDSRGKLYRHSFWVDFVKANGCNVEVSYMLGFGANYIWFLPSNLIAIRFMDEYDFNYKPLVKALESVKSSCE